MFETSVKGTGGDTTVPPSYELRGVRSPVPPGFYERRDHDIEARYDEQKG
jgi:hypothetical protein